MQVKISTAPLLVGICAAALLAGAYSGVQAQAPAQGRAGGGGGRGNMLASGLFAALDSNKDGSLTQQELTASFDKWLADSGSGGVMTEAQLSGALAGAMPAMNAGGGRGMPPCGGQSATPEVPCASDVQAMMAALPDSAPAKPAKARKVLVLGVADGYHHSNIPLAARTVEELGKKTGAWATTTSYNSADINAANLAQYDAVVLDNTTGCFLDDPADKAATDARRSALLSFVRGGKGLVAIHAAIDSYHGTSCGGGAAAAPAGRAGRAGGGGNFLSNAIAADIVSQADKNNDQKLNKVELDGLANTWYAKLDAGHTGKVTEAEFAAAESDAVRRRPGRTRRPRRSSRRRSAGVHRRPAALAGVQPHGQRLLQVALDVSAAHHRQDRRYAEPADHDVPRPGVPDPR